MPKQSRLLLDGLQNTVIKCIDTYAGGISNTKLCVSNVSSAIVIIKK